MRHFNPSRLTLLIGLFLLIALTACSQATPEPTASPTITSSPTVTFTATASVTPSLTPTQTPSVTPSITPSPIPPTETPEGYYVDNSVGYSILLPSNWETTEADNGTITFFDPVAGILMIVEGDAADEENTALEIAQMIKDNALPDNSVVFGEPFEVEAADGVRMEAVDFTVEQEGVKLTWRTIVNYSGGQLYVINILGMPDKLIWRANTLERMLKSLEFFVPSLFGTEAGETLYQLSGEPDEIDLDPALTRGGADGFAGLFFSGLVRLTPDLQIVPDLAESWIISPDGKVYTFTLRPNLQFSNGKPITAEDVRLSWERAADPDTDSTTAKTYMGDILGFNEKIAGDADTISGLKVIDDRTLEVTLDGPKPYFLAKLTYPSSYVVDTTQTDSDIWMWKPNASGPYVLKEYLEQDGILLERNEKYHTSPAIRYLAYDFNAGGSSISLYESNRLDIIGLNSENTLRVRDPQDALHDEWVSTPSLCTSFVLMNNTIPPFDDLNVRKAFLLATDRQMYIENLTDNTDLMATTILPPGMPGFSSDLSALAFDPDAARAALAASQYAGDMPTITLNASGSGNVERDDVAILSEMWKTNLGIEIEVKYLDPQDFTRTARENHDQMVVYGWCADYPDPENFLDILFHTASEMNASGYTNPEIDALLEQARTELDPAKRLQLYHDAEQMLLADITAIPLSHSVWDVLVKPRVLGFILSPSSSAMEMYLSLVVP